MRVVFVGRDRKVWPRLLLYLVTFGISRRVWLYRVNKELDGHEALGLNHRLNAALLAAPLVGLAVLLGLLLSPLPWPVAVGAALIFFVPPTVVVAQTTYRTARMLEGSGIPYGPPLAVYLATWVPLLGGLFHLAWTQGRLNRFWRHERAHPEHGFEIDLDLSGDREYVRELQEALRLSYQAGSRFDRAKQRRAEQRQELLARWEGVRSERSAVRAAGGSTPVLPWLRPQRPPPRRLRITCGRCEHRFEVQRDPFEETPIHCPGCGLHEVLPGLRHDPLARRETKAYTAMRATCPDCGTTSRHHRLPDAPTPIRCPECGREDFLPARADEKATA